MLLYVTILEKHCVLYDVFCGGDDSIDFETSSFSVFGDPGVWVGVLPLIQR